MKHLALLILLALTLPAAAQTTRPAIPANMVVESMWLAQEGFVCTGVTVARQGFFGRLFCRTVKVTFHYRNASDPDSTACVVKSFEGITP